MGTTSHISSVVRTANANTRFVAGGPRLEAQWLDDAYVRARGLDAPPMTAPGVRLVWCRGDELGYHDLVAHPGAYAVVGRHTRCDVTLPNDGAVALRHVLVRATTLDDGSPAVRVLDLRSGLGFHLDDDLERRAVVATGVLAMRLGRYAMIALPSLVELPDTRPAPEIVEARRMPSTSPGLGPAGSERLARSSVTSLPPAPSLQDIASDPAAIRHGKVAASDSITVTLRRGDASASVELSEAALAAGVLVGRADRCEARLRSVLTESISRVHLLLLREHGVLHAFDVASMQGVYAAGERVRRVRLPDPGGSLRLASKDPVLLEWHRSAPPSPHLPEVA